MSRDGQSAIRWFDSLAGAREHAEREGRIALTYIHATG